MTNSEFDCRITMHATADNDNSKSDTRADVMFSFVGETTIDDRPVRRKRTIFTFIGL